MTEQKSTSCLSRKRQMRNGDIRSSCVMRSQRERSRRRVMSEKHAVWCWQVQSASIHHRSTRAEVRGGSSRSTCEQGTAILMAAQEEDGHRRS